MAIVRKEFNFEQAASTLKSYACLWYDEGTLKKRGVIQIAHGMAEHILRYEEFAVFFAKQGFIVCGNDHRGHGQSVEEEKDLGFFGEENGYENMILDMHYLLSFMKKRYPGLPYVLLGHSMGSFLAREFVYEFPGTVDGAVFVGTSGGNPFIDIAIALSERGIKLGGAHGRGHSVNKLAFGPFNLKFLPKKTDYDWICSDEAVVEDYIEDPKCGFIFSYAGYRDLFMLLKKISQEEWAEGVPKELPMLLLSGKDDPVGDYGKGVEKVYNRLRESGCQRVEMKLYEGARHELLNERNKSHVYRFLLKWLNEEVLGEN